VGCFVAARLATIAMLGLDRWGSSFLSQVPLVPEADWAATGEVLLTGAAVQQLPRLVDPRSAGLLAPAA
jgi:hypothetical protein